MAKYDGKRQSSDPLKHKRKGPAGEGKYYTQVHGDIKYNRNKAKKDAERIINEQASNIKRGLEKTIENE